MPLMVMALLVVFESRTACVNDEPTFVDGKLMLVVSV